MFLKRFIILAAGVLLSIAAFVIYFEVSRMQMEDRFRAEREKFHVTELQLTASSPTGETPTPAPTPSVGPDTNTLIGPVPPPASAAPDATAAPTPAPTPDAGSVPTPTPSADSNAAPSTPSAPSTLNSPRLRNDSSVFQFAAYRPSAFGVFSSALVLGQAAATTAPAVAAPAPTTALLAPAAAPSAEKGKVIVLLYHQFKPAGVAIPSKFQWTMNQDVFESEMKYIHDNGYKVIPMSDLLKFLRHEISLPDNCVCITIDDGYKSAIVYAAPILAKYGYPWTFFIYPEFITTAEGPGAASWNDLLKLQSEGIDIECHSMTHPILKSHRQKGKTLSPDEYAAFLKNETADAKAILEEKMGKPITCFAYPYGEYNTQVEQAVLAAGFEAIFTVADNPVHASTSLHSIGRYTITQGVEKNFTAYLHQGALELSAADPAPGATVTNPRPIISATLSYPDPLDPNSIETSMRDMGNVKHDFDPQTNTLRMYLPRDLISPVELVNIRVKDAKTGQIMVANWHFNYEPAPDAMPHAPIPAPTPETTPVPVPATNAAPMTDTIEKNAAGTPLDAHPAPAPVQSLPHTD